MNCSVTPAARPRRLLLGCRASCGDDRCEPPVGRRRDSARASPCASATRRAASAVAAARSRPAGRRAVQASSARRSPPGRRWSRPRGADAIDVGSVGNTPPIFGGRRRARSSARRRVAGRNVVRTTRCSCCPGSPISDVAQLEGKHDRGGQGQLGARPAAQRAAPGGAHARRRRRSTFLAARRRVAAFKHGPGRRVGDLGPVHRAGAARDGRAQPRDRRRAGERVLVLRSRRPRRLEPTRRARPRVRRLRRAAAAGAQRAADTHRTSGREAWSEETELPDRGHQAGATRPRAPTCPVADGRASCAPSRSSPTCFAEQKRDPRRASTSPTSSTRRRWSTRRRADELTPALVPADDRRRARDPGAGDASAPTAARPATPAQRRADLDYLAPDRARGRAARASRRRSRRPARGARTPGSPPPR